MYHTACIHPTGGVVEVTSPLIVDETNSTETFTIVIRLSPAIAVVNRPIVYDVELMEGTATGGLKYNNSQ